MNSGSQPPKNSARNPTTEEDPQQVEEKLINAIGEVIAHWGFKKNHGRIWAFLFLRDCAHSSSDIRLHLGLSKGAASMLLSDLEKWNIVLRESGRRHRKYRANDQLLSMISNVFQTRENILLRNVNSLLMRTSTQQRNGQTVSTPQRIKNLQEFTQVALVFVALVQHLETHSTTELLQLVSQLMATNSSTANFAT